VQPTLRNTVCLFVAFVSIAPGCATLSLQIEKPGDVSDYRTWNFVHPVRGVIHAPLLADYDLEPAVAKQVEIWFSDRGFRRTTSDPDLLVYFELAVRGQLVTQNVTDAVQHLASLHHSPSYEVQVTRTEATRFEIAELLVSVIDSKGRRLVWRGRLNERYRYAFTPHLAEAVSQLLAHVPPPRPSTNRRTVIVKEGTPQGARTTIAPKPVFDALTEPGA
jgi:hypothetical protein